MTTTDIDTTLDALDFGMPCEVDECAFGHPSATHAAVPVSKPCSCTTKLLCSGCAEAMQRDFAAVPWPVRVTCPVHRVQWVARSPWAEVVPL